MVRFSLHVSLNTAAVHSSLIYTVFVCNQNIFAVLSLHACHLFLFVSVHMLVFMQYSFGVSLVCVSLSLCVCMCELNTEHCYIATVQLNEYSYAVLINVQLLVI